MIEMLEAVSSHFQYTEEYVLDRTLPWLKRKFKQADREKYEQKQVQSEETMRGLLAALAKILGSKDADIEQILLKPYDEVQQNYQPAKQSEFVLDQWWNPS